MSTITLPATFRPETFSMYLYSVQRANSSPFGGSEQVVDLLNDRWKISLTLPRGAQSTAASLEAFVAAMRGMTNTCNLWHMARRVPRGTMRGSPVTNPAAQGADQIVIGTGAIGVTLLAGDMLGIAGLLLQVREDCVSDGAGAMTVKFANKFRTAIGNALPVTWDKPTAPFRMVSTPAIQYLPGYAEGMALDFCEVIV